MINSYKFGEIIVDGKRYTDDLIIFPARIKPWWRKRGHEVCKEDLKEVFAEELDILVVGTGSSGLVKILPEVIEKLNREGVKLIAEPTGKSFNTYNKLIKTGKKVIGAFHLTC